MLTPRKIGSFIFFVLGIDYLSFLMEKHRYGNVLRIINYHDLTKEEIPSFVKQIKYLKKHYTFISYSDLDLYFDNKLYVKNPLLLTFDDGLIGDYSYLFPILKRNHIPAVFFVSPGKIGSNNYMTTDMIKEVIESGLVSIGCHTYNHTALNDSLSKKETCYEVVESKYKLEEMFGIEIDSFCWTFGGYDNYSQESFDCVVKAGYKYGFCTYSSPILKDTNKRILPRTNLQNDWNLFEVRYQLSPHHDRKFLKTRKRCEERIDIAITNQLE